MKRILALFLMLIMLLSVLPINIMAYGSSDKSDVKNSDVSESDEILPKLHTVIFYDMGGIKLDVQSVKDKEAAIAPELPEHCGYEFEAWEPNDFSCVTQDMNIYSSWSITVYNITLILSGGSCDNFPENYTIETDDIMLPTPKKCGYIFTGWYENSDLSGETVEKIKKGTYGDITLYAGWDIENYSISYELCGGEMSGSYFNTYNIESPDIYLPTPIRSGYDFMGWYLSQQNIGEPMVCIKSGSYGNLKLYASWKPHEYSINYVLCGGTLTGTYPNTYNIEDENIYLPTPERTGYRFVGWYSSEDYSGLPVSIIYKGTYEDKTYYAKWNLISYTITLKSNGGTIQGAVPATYNIESAIIRLPSATKNGYTFCGWYDNESFSGTAITAIQTGSYGNKIFYAKWSPITYRITYHVNGGMLTSDPINTYTIETQAIRLPSVVRNAYDFMGWYDNVQMTGDAISEIVQGSFGDREFFAKWNAHLYSIIYNTCGGALSGSYVSSYTIESDRITLPTPQRTGYAFTGWYDNSGYAGECIRFINSGSFGNVILYAKWEPYSYNITYNTCGGTISGAYATTYTIESNIILLPTPQRIGYTFDGWYDNYNYSGDSIRIINTGSYGDRVFYAKWNIITYSITYNTNGGIISDFIESYTIESGNIQLPQAEKTGYKFGGWYDNAGFSGVEIKMICSGSTGDRVFYAKFTPITYNITYDLNGGTLDISISSYNIETQTFELPVPTRLGYTFRGWYDNPEFTGNIYTKIEKGTIGNISFYASWDIIIYKITYVVYDGILPQNAPLTYNIESDTFTLPHPTYEGHVFAGWYEDPEMHTAPVHEIINGSYGDKIFYANWRLYRYKVKFFDRDGITLLSEMTVEHGMAATPPETVPEHEGYNFVGWSEDYTYVTSNLDCIAVYELKEYQVTFVDLDYSIISVDIVKHGYAATAPVPPEHENCVFVFWSCDFSCITCDLTVVAVYRATTVTPTSHTGQRFIQDEYMNPDEDYLITTKTSDGVFALTSLCKGENEGLWAMQVKINSHIIEPVEDEHLLCDAVFHTEGAEYMGFTLTSESNNERLTFESGGFTMCSEETETDMFSFRYQNGAWRLYDKTKNVYLSFNEDGRYFESSDLENSAKLQIYKRINLPDYTQSKQPYFSKIYTVVAVRPTGEAYALTEKSGAIIGTPVEVINGKLYFNDNIDEKTVAFRVAFGDNQKGMALRSVSSSQYLNVQDGNVLLDDAINSFWVYKSNEQSGDMALLEVNSGNYIFCNDSGEFSADSNITHTKVFLFERNPSEGKQGDVNLDGSINTGDAVMILKKSAQIITFTDIQEKLGDTNADGRVNTGDAVNILRFTVGTIDWLQ